MEYLRIAECAYNAGAYEETYEIVENVARYTAFESDDLPHDKKAVLVKNVDRAMSRFSFCPDECLWEEMCILSDMFRE